MGPFLHIECMLNRTPSVYIPFANSSGWLLSTLCLIVEVGLLELLHRILIEIANYGMKTHLPAADSISTEVG